MAIALVASTSWAPPSNGGVSPAIDTTGATLLVLSAAWYASPTTTLAVSDSKGNTWSPLTARINGNRQQYFYCLGPTVGTGHTFTLTGSGILPAFHAYAFSGVGSFHSENGLSFSVGPPLACGTVTPPVDGALILAGLTALGNATDTIAPAGFTLSQINYVGGATVQGSSAYYVQPTAAAINPTFSWSGGSHNNVAVAAAVFLPGTPPSTVHTKWRLNLSAGHVGSPNYAMVAEIEFRTTVGGPNQATVAASASADSAYSPPFYAADKAIDNNTTTYWISANSAYPHWWMYTFGAGTDVVQYVIRAAPGADAQYAPKTWTLEYWDGAGWVVADTRINQATWAASEARTFAVAAPAAAESVQTFVILPV